MVAKCKMVKTDKAKECDTVYTDVAGNNVCTDTLCTQSLARHQYPLRLYGNYLFLCQYSC